MEVMFMGAPKFDETYPGAPFHDPGSVSIYVLLDPRDNTVRYVGQTCNPKGRQNSHRSNASTSSEMTAWKADLFAHGHKPVFKAICTVDSSLALPAEAMWIAYYRERGEILNKDVGRPLRADDASSAQIRVRFTQAERDEIERKCEKLGLTMAEAVRMGLIQVGVLSP